MIAQIERAIAALVRTTSAAGTLGYAFGTVASYDEAATAIAAGTLAFPALWVGYDGEPPPERLDAGVYRRRPAFVVSVAAEQWLNVAFARGKAETGAPTSWPTTSGRCSPSAISACPSQASAPARSARSSTKPA